MTNDERKIEVVSSEDQEDRACLTFVIRDEDHTLGNSLRYVVTKNPEVEFCGYSVPHPSENKINFRIQTKGDPAVGVLKKGLNDLNSMCSTVLTTFEKSVDKYQKSTNQGQTMDQS